MKELLSREGVTFTTKNVDEDDQACNELVTRGFRSVPVTIMGDQSIRGYDESALRAAVAALRSS